MLVCPFPAVFPKSDSIENSAVQLEQIKSEYPAFQEAGFFEQPQPPAMYVYQIQSANDAPKTGLIAAVSLQEYIEEHIKRHEHTLVAKEVKQAELLRERGAVVKPVLLAHRRYDALAQYLDRLAQAPVHREIRLADVHEIHRFWKITDPAELAELTQLYARHVSTAYIADGHHRFSSIARLYQHLAETNAPDNPYAYLMCAIFPGDALAIHNFNRVVKAFSKDMTPLAFMARLSKYADLTPLPKARAPLSPHELTLYIEGQWFAMQWRRETLQANMDEGLPTLDVSLLNHYVLQEVLGFADVRHDERIAYAEGPLGLKALERLTRKRVSMAFCLHPLSWESFSRVIDHGLVLPPKSTWFEPRMKNGLVVQVV